MGKITSALKKAAEERLNRIEKISKIKQEAKFVVKQMSKSRVDSSVVTYYDPKALITEQYKILRTNILSLNKGKPPKRIVITSSVHSEGKTITSLNLAFSLAQAVHKPKVLLVDADLRRGRVAKYLGINQPKGLSDLLSNKSNIEDILFHINRDNLAFISSGTVPENPAELLDSETMDQFLNSMGSKFDHILIDTPPIISVTDSGIVGAKADGVLMVIQAGRTQRGIVGRAQELLTQSHAKIIGHVLTNIQYHLPEYIYRYL